MLKSLYRDFSFSASISGLIALVATYSGPVLILIEASKSGGLSQDILSTWIFAVSLGAGITGLWLSFTLKIPFIGAWSTPSVALLSYSLTTYTFEEVVGVYVTLNIIIAIIGFSNFFSKIMSKLPTHLLSAMIAGVLFQFCLQIFQNLQRVPALVLPVIVTYVVCKRLIPRYSVALSFLVGFLCSISTLPFDEKSLSLSFTIIHPELTLPHLAQPSLIGLGIPLLLLALTQYATSIHILNNAGYTPPISTVVGVNGLISIPLSFYGSSGSNPAAIVGAICASDECHRDPKRRYVSGVVCGVGYLIIGLFGASVVSLFAFLPKALITTLAGIALLGTLVSSLTSSLQDEKNRESSIITFAITVSGMSFFGLGSALWGLVSGIIFISLISKNYFSISRGK